MEEFININLEKVFRRCNLSTFGEVSSSKNDSPAIVLPSCPQDGIGDPVPVGQTFLWLRGYASVGQALLSDRTEQECLFYQARLEDKAGLPISLGRGNLAPTVKRSRVAEVLNLRAEP